MWPFRGVLSKREKEIRDYLIRNFGFKPTNIKHYKKAFTHRSTTENSLFSNERLEFLGDSILGSVISRFLFEQYNQKTEGQLTALKGKIVSRKFLNFVANQYDIKSMIEYNEQNTNNSFKFLSGNTLEALIGAIYLDKGFKNTRWIVLNKIFLRFLDEKIINEINQDYKSELTIWAQKNRKSIEYKSERFVEDKDILFRISLFIDKELMSFATSSSKKEATYLAAKEVHTKLEL